MRVAEQDSSTVANRLERLVHDAVTRLAAAHDGTIGAGRVRDTHWAPTKLASAVAGYARRLYEAPVDRLTIAHLIDNNLAQRNHANTAFESPELRHVLPVAGVLALAQHALVGKPEFLVVKTFEGPRQTDSWQSPQHQAPRSVFAFPGEKEAGSTTGRPAYVVLLVVTTLSVVIPIACVPLVSPNWDPEYLERRARARARQTGLSGDDVSSFVSTILAYWRAHGLSLAGRTLPYAAHEIAAELLDELGSAEEIVQGTRALAALPAIGGWLAPGMGVHSGRRERLLGHSLRAMECHRERGGATLYDLVWPHSSVSKSPLEDLPWQLEMPGGGRLTGDALMLAFNACDSTVWQPVPPLLTPGEPGDEYWFTSQGIATDSQVQIPVTLVAHQRLQGSRERDADAATYCQIRVTGDSCDDPKMLGRMLRLSLTDELSIVMER